MRAVLDASALLALLQRETGWQRVLEVLGDAAISVANLAEVAAKHVDLGLDARLLVDRVEALGIEPLPVTAQDVAIQAAIRRLDPGGRLGLSLGDRLCLALAVRLDTRAITADRVWADLDLPIEVEVIR